MSKIDMFTEKRMIRFVEKFRSQSGELPTLKDLKDAGFSSADIELSLKGNVIEQFYITLTTGSVVKVFKIREE